MWAIIGGSGFEKFSGFETVENLDTSSPFGESSSGLKKVLLNGKELIFLSRHGQNHEKLPCEINYRANLFALKKNGATGVLAFSAIGSLREELHPGDLVIPTQYIDRTKGGRNHTFLGDGLVGHVSLAKPVCKKTAQKILRLTKSRNDYKSHTERTYITIEGPYFSSQAESHFFRQMGADIIGMTNFPEYALAREAGLGYMPLCFVTDYDCWREETPHATARGVAEVAQGNNKKAFDTCLVKRDT